MTEPLYESILTRLTETAAEGVYGTSREIGERIDTGEVVADTVARFLMELTEIIADNIGGICRDVDERVDRWMEQDREKE